MTPSGMRGVLNDAVSIYFLDATLASAFVARWCAGSRDPAASATGTDGLQTPRWRKADSNRWSHFQNQHNRGTGPMSPTASIRVALLTPLANSISISVASGTSGSNLLSSSSESRTKPYLLGGKRVITGWRSGSLPNYRQR